MTTVKSWTKGLIALAVVLVVVFGMTSTQVGHDFAHIGHTAVIDVQHFAHGFKAGWDQVTD